MVIEHAIHIDAPREAVWAITEDVERWPEWTPTMLSVQRLDAGPFGLGSKVRIRQPVLTETEWTVTRFTPGEGFSWEAKTKGMHLTATHELIVDGACTINHLRVSVRGPVATLLWPLLRPAMQKALSQENAGLKNRSEEMAREGEIT